MEHPDDTTIEGYARRTLPPPDLLAVDDHLAACERCRRRAGALAGVSRSLTGLRAELLPPESHLGDEDASDYVAGRLSPPRRAALEEHIGACAVCAREVEDLRLAARTPSVPRALWYAAAAAVLLVVLIPLILHRRPPSHEETAATASLAGVEGLPAVERERVAVALRAGVAQPPAFLSELGGGPEVLMGPTPVSSAFRLVEPVGTAVVSDRPAFRWQPLAETDAYVVSVADETLRPVAESPRVSMTTWTPERPLARGRTYVWQVTAYRGSQSVTASAPPAPLAKIRILDGETARLLEQTAAAHPDSHLLLGILYARAGVRGEAESHLSRVATTDGHFAVAQRTLERLRPPGTGGR